MKRKTKRLLAKFLALVMVLSLCEITLGQSAPAKAAVSLQNPTHQWKWCNNMGLYLFWKLLAE